VTLPPLRDREDDVVLLAETFLKRFATEEGKRKLRFAKEALIALQKYPWPGNVRELENRVKRAVVMCDDARVTAQDLGLSSATESDSFDLRAARDQLERDMLTKALRRHGGKITAAAAELGISRPTFYEMMEKLGIQKEVRE
jgi:two-component system, NtrC family, response regulator